MNLELKGKTAVVTGASMGLGRAIAKALALEGVTVFATARTDELLQTLSAEIVSEAGPQPVLFAQDFIAADAPAKIAAQGSLKTLGHVDILVNVAGASYPVYWEAGDEEWEKGMRLNFERHRQLTHALLPAIVERRRGRIISISGSSS